MKDRLDRPDPEALLTLARAEEQAAHRGRLQIFFGASAGVGKTYAMLAAAQALARQGGDVVVGWVDTHGRTETAALLDGLEVLPPRRVEHRGIELLDLDLDAALARRPSVLLVDELAHTNAADARHPKRWQDVEELLAAGIDVWSTLNVQHLESLNDLVAQITGVAVRETVPDSFFDRADPVRLVDLAPGELLERLAQGKVYLPESAHQAREGFFRRGNLIALRELALRKTADRVDDQMLRYREQQGIAPTWPVAERLVVAAGSGPQAERVVRAGRRLAEQLRAEWSAIYVETERERRLPQADRDRVWGTLRLAEQLGASTRVLSGLDPAAEILLFARRANASKLVLGKPEAPRWRDRLFGSFAERLIRDSGDIDIYILSGLDAPTGRLGRVADQRALRERWKRSRSRPRAYLFGLVAIVFASGFAALMAPSFGEANLVMVYLLAVVGTALWAGRGPAILASLAGVAAFDFFFVSPRLTFAVDDTQYVVTFVVMLVTALAISMLTARLRTQVSLAAEREERTAALYDLARELAGAADLPTILGSAARHLREMFSSQVVILLPDGVGAEARLTEWASDTVTYLLNERELAVAAWVFDHGRWAGLTTETLPASLGLYVPLTTARGTFGVLGLHPADRPRLTRPDQKHLLEVCAGQIALAVELRTRERAAPTRSG